MDIKVVLEKHGKWLRDEPDGELADLQGADLRLADLQGAKLHGADLRGADLDMSCLPLSCGSLKMKTDEKQRIQILFHYLSLIKHGGGVTKKEKGIYKSLKAYANKFHRVGRDVEKLEG